MHSWSFLVRIFSAFSAGHQLKHMKISHSTTLTCSSAFPSLCFTVTICPLGHPRSTALSTGHQSCVLALKLRHCNGSTLTARPPLDFFISSPVSCFVVPCLYFTHHLGCLSDWTFSGVPPPLLNICSTSREVPLPCSPTKLLLCLVSHLSHPLDCLSILLWPQDSFPLIMIGYLLLFILPFCHLIDIKY